MHNVEIYFLLFLSYAFLGWVVEVINEMITTGKTVNRGFLIGPYLPIYGFGGLFITLLLQKYSNDPIVLFLLSIIICSVLEYYTSYFMEKIFNARWWDYTNRKFNINGRICLETMIPFGLLGMLMIYVINPFLIGIYSKLNDALLNILSISLFLIFIFDVVISFNVLGRIKNDIKKYDKDNTEEITKKVKDLILSKSWIFKRIANAFPNAIHISKIKENIKNITSELINPELIKKAKKSKKSVHKTKKV